MAQLKKMVITAAFLMVCGSCAFAQAQQQSPPPRGGEQATDPRMDQAIDMMFREMDTDHDGRISKKEWDAFHEKQFKRLDKNGDGFITKDEVKADMKERMRNRE